MPNNIQRLELLVKNAMQVYWDDALTSRRKENPFPLAPPDEVWAGHVDPRRYKRQNMRLKYKSKKAWFPEITRLAESRSFLCGIRTVVILGWGLGRDTEDLVLALVAAGFIVIVIDVSTVACRKCRAFVKKHGLQEAVVVHKMELEAAWRREIIDESQVLAYFGSQFIQNQDREAMDRMMMHFGFFFLWAPDRAVYLMHAKGEDNPPEEVKWRNSIPFLTNELKLPIARGFGGPVKMDEVGYHRYYNQRYTFLRLSAP